MNKPATTKTNSAPSLNRRIIGFLGLERNIAIASAGFLLIGMSEELWKINPATPFYAACTFGIAGVIVFALTMEERYAS